MRLLFLSTYSSANPGYLCTTVLLSAAIDPAATPPTEGREGTLASTTSRTRLEGEGKSQPLTLSLLEDSGKKPVVMLHPTGKGHPREGPMPRTQAQQAATGGEVPIATATQSSTKGKARLCRKRERGTD